MTEEAEVREERARRMDTREETAGKETVRETMSESRTATRLTQRREETQL